MSVRIVIEGPAQVLQDGILISTPGFPHSRTPLPGVSSSSPIAASASHVQHNRCTKALTAHEITNELKESHSVVERGSDTSISRELRVSTDVTRALCPGRLSTLSQHDDLDHNQGALEAWVQSVRQRHVENVYSPADKDLDPGSIFNPPPLTTRYCSIPLPPPPKDPSPRDPSPRNPSPAFYCRPPNTHCGAAPLMHNHTNTLVSSLSSFSITTSSIPPSMKATSEHSSTLVAPSASQSDQFPHSSPPLRSRRPHTPPLPLCADDYDPFEEMRKKPRAGRPSSTTSSSINIPIRGPSSEPWISASELSS